MTVPSQVFLQADEIVPMQSAMRDVQVSIADYYRQTSGFIDEPDVYTTPVRSAVGFIQKLNEVMNKKLMARADYKIIFADRLANGDAGAETIEGLRYLRNIGQHLLHPVVPETGRVVGNNLGLGFRTASHWAPVSPLVDSQLESRTQQLKPLYDKTIAGKSTIDPLLTACRFFSEICPQMVHRDSTEEWTSFPLRVQWGTSESIHPDEPYYDFSDRPKSESEIREWLNTRKPGGDSRWIAGRLTTTKGAFVYGLTFRNNVSYMMFSDTVEQVKADLRMGYPYWRGIPAQNIAEKKMLNDHTGAKFQPIVLSEPFESWAIRETLDGADCADFCSWKDDEEWAHQIEKTQDLTLRKAQRLNAWFPIFL
jgi:hypothetical protein